MKPRLTPLTDAQRALASDPEHLALAEDLGRSVCARSLPYFHDDIMSAAYFALCKAARAYKPDSGVPFHIYATITINLCARRAVLDQLTFGFTRSALAPRGLAMRTRSLNSSPTLGTFGHTAEARYFWADWLYATPGATSHDPTKRKPRDTTLPPGVLASYKGDTYTARVWSPEHSCSVNLGTFPVARYGSWVRARDAAAAAYRAFKDRYHPGCDIRETFDALKRDGLIAPHVKPPKFVTTTTLLGTADVRQQQAA